MAQLMRPGDVCLDSGAPDRPPDDLTDVAVRTQAIEGRPRAQEDPAARRFRSPVLQVGCNRLADVMWQRQRPFLPAFAMHAQAPFRPVDIPEFEVGYFPCAQPKTRKQQQNGSIAQPSRRAPCFAFVQKSANALRWHRSWNRRHRPSSDTRDRRCKIRLDVVTIPGEAEERTQRRDDVLGRRECTVPRRLAPDIVGNLDGMDGGEPQLPRTADARQKSSYNSGIILERRWRKA